MARMLADGKPLKYQGNMNINPPSKLDSLLRGRGVSKLDIEFANALAKQVGFPPPDPFIAEEFAVLADNMEELGRNLSAEFLREVYQCLK